MLKLSKKIEYAIIAVIHMSNAENDDLVTAKMLSQHYNIPPEIMGKVLQSLAKNEIIISHQGVKGGYRLHAPLEKLNINSIINAVEKPIHLVDCVVEDGDCSCGQLSFCNIKGPMELIQDELTSFFDNITLKDFKEKYKNYVPLWQIKTV